MLYDRFDDMRAKTTRINLQEKTVTPTKNGFEVLPDSNYNGLSKVNVNGDNNLISENIKKDITIFGVTGTLPATSEILEYYFTLSANNNKYKYKDLQKRNPAINTSLLTTMESMFEDSGIDILDLTTFDTSNVTSFLKFCKNGNLSTFIKGSLDTDNATTFKEMFSLCTNLLSIDLSNIGTSNVTDMSYMFNGCSSIQNINLSGYDTSNVTDMSYMFNGCSSLMTLNLKGFDFSNVVTSTDMFTGVPYNCAITVSSDDAKNFILALRPDFTNISVVADIYVATTNNGIFISRNGTSWTRVSTTSKSKVKFLNGMFFACDFSSNYLYSYDGVTWTQSSQSMDDITFDGTNFIGVRGSSIYTSANGVSWTLLSSTLPFTDTRGGIESDLNGKLCVGGYNNGVAISSDGGLTWTQYNIGKYINGLSVLNGIFYVSAFTNNTTFYQYKFDGTSWNQVYNLSSISAGSGSSRGYFAKNIYVIPCGTARKIIRSTDGINFSPINVGNQGASSTGLGGLTYNGIDFCVFEGLSNPQLQKSSDGNTWTGSSITADNTLGTISSMVFKSAE